MRTPVWGSPLKFGSAQCDLDCEEDAAEEEARRRKAEAEEKKEEKSSCKI